MYRFQAHRRSSGSILAHRRRFCNMPPMPRRSRSRRRSKYDRRLAEARGGMIDDRLTRGTIVRHGQRQNRSGNHKFSQGGIGWGSGNASVDAGYRTRSGAGKCTHTRLCPRSVRTLAGHHRPGLGLGIKGQLTTEHRLLRPKRPHTCDASTAAMVDSSDEPTGSCCVEQRPPRCF
jgi:hypothetical protein